MKEPEESRVKEAAELDRSTAGADGEEATVEERARTARAIDSRHHMAQEGRRGEEDTSERGSDARWPVKEQRDAGGVSNSTEALVV